MGLEVNSVKWQQPLSTRSEGTRHNDLLLPTVSETVSAACPLIYVIQTLVLRIWRSGEQVSQSARMTFFELVLVFENVRKNAYCDKFPLKT